MKKIFELVNWELKLNDAHILLVKEFADLYDEDFNKGFKGDKDGKNRKKAFAILTYIYLVYDWRTPFGEFSDVEKHQEAITSSEIEESWLKEPVVMAAIRKYRELQDTRMVKLLNSTHKAIDELRLYFETIDLTITDPDTGKPIYTAKDLIANINALGKSVLSLQELENVVKKDMESTASFRGDNTPGMFDTEQF